MPGNIQGYKFLEGVSNRACYKRTCCNLSFSKHCNHQPLPSAQNLPLDIHKWKQACRVVDSAIHAFSSEEELRLLHGTHGTHWGQEAQVVSSDTVDHVKQPLKIGRGLRIKEKASTLLLHHRSVFSSVTWEELSWIEVVPACRAVESAVDAFMLHRDHHVAHNIVKQAAASFDVW